MSLRKAQKEATRQRVVESARELFEAKGYQETTIREIARQAGVSVGGVFTNFGSKGDILSQVMADRLDALYAELDRVIPHLRGSTADRICTLFSIHYAFESTRTRLFLAHIAAAFDWSIAPDSRPYGRTRRLRQMVLDCITDGVQRGDVDRGVDADALVDALMACYAWTYRLAAWENASAETMSAAFDAQVRLMAEGFRPRSPALGA